MNDYIWLKPENSNVKDEMIEVAVLDDYKMYYPPMPLYKRILDFIKSWIYYTNLKKYAIEQGGLMKEYISKTSRFQYSWWHCRKGIYNGWFGRI